MSDDITALVGRAKSGELAAASELLTQSYERIFAYFRRLCGSDEDAADMTQKTFCKVWNSLANYNGRASFNTWLHAIAHHVYVDWRRRSTPAELASDEWWLHCVDHAPSPSETAANREQAQQVYSLVEQRDHDTRQTVHLHYYQGLSLAETAEVLGIATSTVKYRLREAVEFLKTKMAEPRIEVR